MPPDRHYRGSGNPKGEGEKGQKSQRDRRNDGRSIKTLHKRNGVSSFNRKSKMELIQI